MKAWNVPCFWQFFATETEQTGEFDNALMLLVLSGAAWNATFPCPRIGGDLLLVVYCVGGFLSHFCRVTLSSYTEPRTLPAVQHGQLISWSCSGGVWALLIDGGVQATVQFASERAASFSPEKTFTYGQWQPLLETLRFPHLMRIFLSSAGSLP